MKYKIADGFSQEDLEEEVNRMLGNGWKLVGGVAIGVCVATSIDGETSFEAFYCQAMTKGEESDA